MHLQFIGSQNVNFDGSFVFQTKLSKQEKKMFDSFTENEQVKNLMKKLPCDLTVKRWNQNRKFVEFWASFDKIYPKKSHTSYMSSLNLERYYSDSDVDCFRKAIEWLETYKKEVFGYNNKFEKIKAKIRYFFHNWTK